MRKGKVTIKFDLIREGIPCPADGTGGPPTITWAFQLACYEPDLAYAPLITFPFASDPTQGGTAPGFAGRPSSPLLAVWGTFQGP